MIPRLLFGKLRSTIWLGTVGLLSVLPLQAQDDATEKKDPPIAIEEPADSAMP